MQLDQFKQKNVKFDHDGNTGLSQIYINIGEMQAITRGLLQATSQEIGWEDSVQNDLHVFCDEWNVKLQPIKAQQFIYLFIYLETQCHKRNTVKDE